MQALTSIKRAIIHMAHYSHASHVGSCLSIAEILYTLYFRILNITPQNARDEQRDIFILSKGHGSAALYATLAERGFFPKEYLERYYIDGGLLPGHLDRDSVPGVEVSSGSLGHGLSIALGMALARLRNGSSSKVYVLLGDGECNEGSVWEAVMLAASLKIPNLTAIVDFNKLQGFGKTNEVIDQHNLSARWAAFGWESYDLDGHDINALEACLQLPQQGPKAIIAHTIKGNGISFMADRLEWHYKSPNDDQYRQALGELGGTL